MKEVVRIGDLTCTVINQSEVKTKPQGAVVLCHGFGAPGADLVPIATEIIGFRPQLKDVVFVFPNAPIELDPHFDSRAWWMIDIEKIQSLMMTGEFRELKQTVPAELQLRRQQLFSVVDNIRNEFELPANRVVVGGFSQGAMLATDVALNYPESLAGLIIWSGTLMNEDQWSTAAKQAAPLSIVQSHGRFDPILPFAGAEHLRDLLVQHGHDVNFVPFNGQHGIDGEALLAAVNLLESVF